MGRVTSSLLGLLHGSGGDTVFNSKSTPTSILLWVRFTTGWEFLEKLWFVSHRGILAKLRFECFFFFFNFIIIRTNLCYTCSLIMNTGYAEFQEFEARTGLLLLSCLIVV